MKEKLVQFLTEKYNPIGIILHGSRAGDYARANSDWDFIVFVEEKIDEGRKDEPVCLYNQYLDVAVWEFPPKEGFEKKFFVKYFNFAELVFYQKDSVAHFFSKVKKINEDGLLLDTEEINFIKNKIQKYLEKMVDWIDDDQGIFFLRLSEFYRIVYNAWWNIKMKKYSVSHRKGIEFIKLQDKEFFDLLQIISGNKTNKEKYQASVKLNRLLFN